MEQKPLVSVIIPNYNHAPYLRDRINSVLHQTYNNIEVIILDDHSRDNSKEVIEVYRNDPRIKEIIYNEKNSGNTFKQWNKGVEKCAGEYVWIAESDDVAHPEFLSSLISNITEKTVLAFSASNMINEEGSITGNLLWWTHDLDKQRWKNNFTEDGNIFIQKYLSVKNVTMNASAILFRKDAYVKNKINNEHFTLCGDWYTWIKIAEQGQVFYHSENLNNYRFHHRSVRNKTSKSKIVFQESLMIRSECLQKFSPDKRERRMAAKESYQNWINYLRNMPLYKKWFYFTKDLLWMMFVHPSFFMEMLKYPIKK